jgi:hypothetical protein
MNTKKELKFSQSNAGMDFAKNCGGSVNNRGIARVKHFPTGCYLKRKLKENEKLADIGGDLIDELYRLHKLKQILKPESYA